MNIVITGAGGVLCSAFSRALAADGHKIALLDLNLEAAEREAEGIRKAGGEAIAVQTNVLDKESLKKAHDVVLEKFGPCEVLINGAGGNNPKGTTTSEYCPGCVGVWVRCNGGGSIRELQLILVILPGQVTRQFQVPGAALTALHGQGAKVGSFRLCVRARSKAVQRRAARRGGPQAECRSAAAPHCTKVISGINRQLRCLCFVHGDSSY